MVLWHHGSHFMNIPGEVRQCISLSQDCMCTHTHTSWSSDVTDRISWTSTRWSSEHRLHCSTVDTKSLTQDTQFSEYHSHISSGYCNRRNFCTRFNFVFFVLLAESTKFYSIRKTYTYTSVCDTTLAVRKFVAYESPLTLEYEIFTRTKISAITVTATPFPCWLSSFSPPLYPLVSRISKIQNPLFLNTPYPLNWERFVCGNTFKAEFKLGSECVSGQFYKTSRSFKDPVLGWSHTVKSLFSAPALIYFNPCWTTGAKRRTAVKRGRRLIFERQIVDFRLQKST